MQSIRHQRSGVGGTAGFSGGSLSSNSRRKRKASTPRLAATSSGASYNHNTAAKRRKMGLLQRFIAPLQTVLVNGFGRLSAQPSLQLKLEDRSTAAYQGNNKCSAPQCSPVPRRRTKRSRQPLRSHKDAKAKSKTAATTKPNNNDLSLDQTIINNNKENVAPQKHLHQPLLRKKHQSFSISTKSIAAVRRAHQRANAALALNHHQQVQAAKVLSQQCHEQEYRLNAIQKRYEKEEEEERLLCELKGRHQRRARLWKKNWRRYNIVRIQSLCRGYLVRKKLFVDDDGVLDSLQHNGTRHDTGECVDTIHEDNPTAKEGPSEQCRSTSLIPNDIGNIYSGADDDETKSTITTATVIELQGTHETKLKGVSATGGMHAMECEVSIDCSATYQEGGSNAKIANESVEFNAFQCKKDALHNKHELWCKSDQGMLNTEKESHEMINVDDTPPPTTRGVRNAAASDECITEQDSIEFGIAERVKGRTKRRCASKYNKFVDERSTESQQPAGSRPIPQPKATLKFDPHPTQSSPKEMSAIDDKVSQNYTFETAVEEKSKALLHDPPPNDYCCDCSRLCWDLWACDGAICCKRLCHTCAKMNTSTPDDDVSMFCKECYPSTTRVFAGVVRSPLNNTKSVRQAPLHVDEAKEEAENDEPFLAEMNAVEHLCKTTLDPLTGLPIQDLTILCNETESLFSFRINIKQSTIPGSGQGAFLTYLGRRVLKSEAAARSRRLMKQHVAAVDIITRNSLNAETADGRRMSVSLSGTNLHYNDNCLYWSSKYSEKFSLNENRKRKRKRGSPESFDESKVNCEVHNEVKRLRQEVDGKGIGFLCIHRESDYCSVDETPYWSSGCFIELGSRYGPHIPSDRKPKLHFDFKVFIHDNEPSEWSYGVNELINSQTQMIDITDDATGEIHSDAFVSTPTYVNEVGHDPSLQSLRNVHIVSKHDRSIHYYVCIREEQAMMKGQTVELFTNYGAEYEAIRERKGYSSANLAGKVGSDEDGSGWRLYRNFVEREAIEQDISTIEVRDCHSLCEFINDRIYEPIIKHMAGSLGRLKARVLIARQRIHWISQRMERRLQKWESSTWLNKEQGDLISSIRKTIQPWQFKLVPAMLSSLNHDSRMFITGELMEELLYESLLQETNPLDECVWRKLVADLLARDQARTIMHYLLPTSEPLSARQEYLAKDLWRLAQEYVSIDNSASVLSTK